MLSSYPLLSSYYKTQRSAAFGRTTLLLALVALLLTAVSAQSSTTCEFPVPKPMDAANPPPLVAGALHEVDTLLEDFANQNGHIVPGFSVGVLHDQDILMSKGFGKMDATDPMSPTPDGNTVYGIGSITKVYTSLLMHLMHEKGSVDMNDPITDYLPLEMSNSFLKENVKMEDITLEMLSSHMSGLPRFGPCVELINGDCDFDDREALIRLRAMDIVNAPNTQPSYSNLGFALLGRALGRARKNPRLSTARKSYELLMKENIFDVLKLGNTTFDPTDAAFASGVATPHTLSTHPDTLGQMAVTPTTDQGWMAPAGQIHSSVNDVLKTIAAVLRNASYGDAFHNKFEAAEEIVGLYDHGPIFRRPSFSLRPDMVRRFFDIRYIASDGLTGYGRSWETLLYKQQGSAYQVAGNYWIRGKSGGVTGYRAQLFVVPEMKLATVILFNTDAISPQSLALSVINKLIPAFDATLRISSIQQPPVVPASFAAAIHNAKWSTVDGSVNITTTHQGFGMVYFTITYAWTSRVMLDPFPATYMPGSLGRHVLRAGTPAGINVPLSCGSMQNGYFMSYLYFDEAVQTMTTDLLHGKEFKRVY